MWLESHVPPFLLLSRAPSVVLLQSCNVHVFYPSKNICILLEVNLYACSLCVLVVQKCLESNRHFTLRTHSDVLDRFIGPSKLQMLELSITWYVCFVDHLHETH